MTIDELQNVDESQAAHFYLRTFTQEVLPGNLVFIAARPADGKTRVAVNLAVSFAIQRRQPTCYISLEYRSDVITKIMTSTVSSIPSDTLNKGSLPIMEFGKLLRGVEKIYDAPFYLIDPSEYHIDTLAEDIHRLKVEHRIEVVFIDYLSLIRTDLDGTDRYPSLIARLQRIAEEEHVAIVALLQIKRYRGSDLETHVASELSRLGADKHPTLLAMKIIKTDKGELQHHLRLFNSTRPVIVEDGV
jgi:replicative DNA helicase